MDQGQERRDPRKSFSALGHSLLFWLFYLATLWVAAQVQLFFPEQFQRLVWGVTSSAILLAGTLLFVRWERRSLREVGLGWSAKSPPKLLLGTLVGLLVYGVVIILIMLSAGTGGVSLERNEAGSLAPAIVVVLTIFALSLMEELGFRGYPLFTLEERYGVWRSQLIVATAFGLVHIAYGWAWPSVVLGVMPAALLFGMSAAASRGLAMPVGVHAGVNLAQWALGEKEEPGLWTIVVSDEAAGVVGSISTWISVGVVLGAAAGFWLWVSRIRRGETFVEPEPSIGSTDV